MTQRAAVLLHYDAALPRLTRRSPIDQHGHALPDTIYCVGYPRLSPSHDVCDAWSELLGRRVEPLPVELTPEEECALAAPLLQRLRAHPVASDAVAFKQNDRYYYRMLPLGRVEFLVSRALRAAGGGQLLVPWLSERYDLVERSGLMAGLDAPGHSVAAMVERLRELEQIEVTALWPGADRNERLVIPAARAGMLAARVSVLFGRAVRARVRNRAMEGVGHRKRIGFLVGGAAAAQTLAPVIEAVSTQADPQVFSYDIIRNPTAEGGLRKANIPFTSLYGALGPLASAAVLATSTHRARRHRAVARALADSAATQTAREDCLLIEADLAAAPELDLYVAQVRRVIRDRNLSLVVSANCVDAFLSATTHACHAEGVRHVCVQNASIERIPQPVFADCDNYFAESKRLAEFMRSWGARAEVEALGLPYYDTVQRARGSSDKPLRAAVSAIAGKRVVTVATQTEIVDTRPALEALIAWAESRDDVAIVIKLHPRESPDAWRDLGDRLERSSRGGRVQSLAIEAVLAESDYFVSSTSTTILWSILVGVRPFAFIEPSWRMFLHTLDYLRPEVTTTFESATELAAAIDSAFGDEPQQRAWLERRERFLAEHLTGCDGRATQRVADRVLALAAAS